MRSIRESTLHNKILNILNGKRLWDFSQSLLLFLYFFIFGRVLQREQALALQKFPINPFRRAWPWSRRCRGRRLDDPSFGRERPLCLSVENYNKTNGRTQRFAPTNSLVGCRAGIYPCRLVRVGAVIISLLPKTWLFLLGSYLLSNLWFADTRISKQSPTNRIYWQFVGTDLLGGPWAFMWYAPRVLPLFYICQS